MKNLLWPLLLAAAVSCGGEDSDGKGRGGASASEVDECDDAGDTYAFVMSSLTFVREVEGITDGFDIDGDVSTAGGAGGCGLADMRTEDGRDGIDNAFSKLLPALELTEAAAIEAIAQEAINGGSLLVMLEATRVDDIADDACVDLSVSGALGTPMVGTDGLLLPNQTFVRDPSAPTSTLEDSSIVDGVIEDGPLDLYIPFVFLDADVVFHLHQGMVRLEQQPDGSVVGMLGGGLEVQALIDLAKNTGIAQEVEILLESLLPLAADLGPGPDGACTQISVTLQFDALPAFYYEGELDD